VITLIQWYAVARRHLPNLALGLFQPCAMDDWAAWHPVSPASLLQPEQHRDGGQHAVPR
jgi:hypothetical protein